MDSGSPESITTNLSLLIGLWLWIPALAPLGRDDYSLSACSEK